MILLLLVIHNSNRHKPKILKFKTSGTGILEVHGNTRVNGNIHATGNIRADGNIQIGDSDTDPTINADITSNLTPRCIRHIQYWFSCKTLEQCVCKQFNCRQFNIRKHYSTRTKLNSTSQEK